MGSGVFRDHTASTVSRAEVLREVGEEHWDQKAWKALADAHGVSGSGSVPLAVAKEAIFAIRQRSINLQHRARPAITLPNNASNNKKK